VHNFSLSDFIRTFDDFGNKSLLDAIDNVIFKKSNFLEAQVVAKNGQGLIDPEVRRVKTLFFKEEDIGNSISSRILFNELTRTVNTIYNTYCSALSLKKEEQAEFDYSFLKYQSEDKGHYDWHKDSGKFTPREFTIIVGLNNDYMGGQLNVINDKYKFKLKKNQAVMFPSNLCFPHKVEPVLEGVRKVLVIWIR
jgi:predicted 2-oxoglutarate/Fe(II)-dependent dioxygenase YbiX